MSTPQFHQKRLSGQLAHEIAWTIANTLNDPRIAPIVTVTEVRLAPDMKSATVFVGIMGEEKEVESTLIALERATPFIQRTVAQRVRVKHFPQLQFKLDDSLDRGKRIDDLLDQIKDDLV